MQAALAVMAIAPPEGTIISDQRDIPLAREAGLLIVQVGNAADSMAMAAHLAEHNSLISLVIGAIPAGIVRSVYADGKSEDIPYAAN